MTYYHRIPDSEDIEVFCAFDSDGGGFYELIAAEHHIEEGEWYYYATSDWCDSARLADLEYCAQLLRDGSDKGFSCGSYRSLEELIEDNKPWAEVLRVFCAK